MHSAKLELLTTPILTTPFCCPVLFQMDVLMPFLILPLVESSWSLTDPYQNFHIIMLKSYHFSKIVSICIIGSFEKSLFSLTINNFQMIISQQQLCLNESKEKPKQHCLFSVQFSSFQFTQVCTTLCDPTDWSKLGFSIHHWLPDLTQTHVHWIGDTIQPSHPLSSPSPAFNHSHHRVFSNESVLRISWPKYWSFSFSISPSNEYSGLISYRMDWLDLLAVQRTLKSHLQHHSSKASVPWHSDFFMVQLLYLYMTTGKIIALTR